MSGYLIYLSSVFIFAWGDGLYSLPASSEGKAPYTEVLDQPPPVWLEASQTAPATALHCLKAGRTQAPRPGRAFPTTPVPHSCHTWAPFQGGPGTVLGTPGISQEREA